MSPRGQSFLREVVSSGDPSLIKAHRLLRRIFPKSELVSAVEWRHSLREGEAELWTDLQWHLLVAEARGRVLGVATGTYLGNVNVGVIGYVAVTPAGRRLGLGSKLRNKLRRLFERDAVRIRRETLRGMVGEVRRDNPWLRALIRRRRVLALNFAYHQPKLHRGQPTVPMVFYYESMDRIRRRLPTVELRRLLFTIWRRIYRIPRPMSDPAFRRMLRELAGRASIGAIRR